MTTVVWLREDLRLIDNPALHFAASQGDVYPVYIYPDGLGAASYWWLHHSLASLSNELSKVGVKLILKTGDPVKILRDVCHTLSANHLVWNRVYSPEGTQLGTRVKQGLLESGINRIDGVEFKSSQIEKYKREARIKAVKNAKEKAVTYAKVLDQSVGKAISISESSVNNYPYPQTRFKSANLEFDANSSAQTIAIGEMEVRTTVAIVFELK